MISLLSNRKSELFLFGIAAGARGLTTLFQIIYGIHSISLLPGAIAWSDFFTLNGGQLQALSHGLVPYRDFSYAYTPLFLYALYPFYIIGGIEAAVIPILVADSATAVLVYLLARSAASNRIALIAGIAYALSPFVLYQEGYLFLSSQPMVFFLLLSIYFLQNERPLESSLTLGLSILFKQEALFILPVYAVWYITKYKAQVWKGAAILSSVIFVVSMPFLVLAPVQYLIDVSYGVMRPILPSLSSPLQIVAIGSTSRHSVIPTSQACASLLASLPTTGTYVVCGVTYSWATPTILDRLASLIGLIPWVANATSIPVFLMITPALYVSRRRRNILLLSCAYSLIGFLIIFSLTVHGLYSYYFLPVYALLFASATARSSAIIALIISGISILVPDGTIEPVFVTSLGILCILATRDSEKYTDFGIDAKDAVISPNRQAQTGKINNRCDLKRPKCQPE